MRNNRYIVQYYVEGDNEEKLINTLKSKLCVNIPGKVQKFNVIEREITDARLRTLAPKTIVVLVFDTDTGQRAILDRNIKKLKSCSSVSDVIMVPQVPNLEGELIRCCSIKNITELLNCKSIDDFKRDFNKVTNLDQKLLDHSFDISLIWSKSPPPPYQNIPNQSAHIKLIK